MKSSTLPLSAALPGIGITLPTLWVKELRVILPTILGCSFLLLLSIVLPSEFRNSIIVLVYPLACSAVFALAFGHDYMHRTLTSALSQPIERRKIFWTRMLLCIAALIPLLALDFLTYFWMQIFNRHVAFFMPWPSIFNISIRLLEPIITAICLAPFLTIASRSVLFGAIISTGAPFALGVLVRAIALKIGFEDGPLLVAIHLTASLTLLVTGAILGYRRFITQEAIDSDIGLATPKPTAASKGQTSDVQTRTASGSTPQLLKKEFMLQRFPIALSLFIITLIFITPKEHAELLPILLPAIIIVIGAIASADERRLGIIPSQVLHPIAFRKQWLIKIVTAYFIAIIFAVVLPLLALLIRTNEIFKFTHHEIVTGAPFIFGGTLLILSFALYISSISDTSVRAVIVSLFILSISMMAIGHTVNEVTQWIWESTGQHVSFTPPEPGHRVGNTINIAPQVQTFAIATLGFIALALYFAMQNHRYLERSSRRLFRQAATLILYELAALVAISLTI